VGRESVYKCECGVGDKCCGCGWSSLGCSAFLPLLFCPELGEMANEGLLPRTRYQLAENALLTSRSTRDVGSYPTLTCMLLYVHSRHPLLLEESGKVINTDLDSVIKPWHVYVGYIVINAFAFGWNCYARWLPVIAQVSLFTSLISFFVIIVTVPAKASPHQDARFVFANFVNATGWNQNGIGMSISLVSFSSGTRLLSVFHDSLTAYSLATFTERSTDILQEYGFSQIQVSSHRSSI